MKSGGKLPSIHLRIERVTVQGIPMTSLGAARLQASIARELSGLLARGRPLPSAPGKQPQIRLTAGAGPAEIGRQIARELFSRIDPRIQSAINRARQINGEGTE